jgi:hypothetical protein
MAALDPDEVRADVTDVEDVLPGGESDAYALGEIEAALKQAHSVMKRRVYPYVADEHDLEDITLTEALLAADLLTSMPPRTGAVTVVRQESAELHFDPASEARATPYWRRAVLVDPTGALGSRVTGGVV